MTTPTAEKTVIIRCIFVQCPAFRTVFYATGSERGQLLDDNARDPWQCGRHPRERSAA